METKFKVTTSFKQAALFLRLQNVVALSTDSYSLGELIPHDTVVTLEFKGVIHRLGNNMFTAKPTEIEVFMTKVSNALLDGTEDDSFVFNEIIYQTERSPIFYINFDLRKYEGTDSLILVVGGSGFQSIDTFIFKN